MLKVSKNNVFDRLGLIGNIERDPLSNNNKKFLKTINDKSVKYKIAVENGIKYRKTSTEKFGGSDYIF